MKKIGKWIALGMVAVAGAWARAEEWPKWLGPEGTGIVKDAGSAAKWPASGPKRLWSAKVGGGFSTPVGFEGKLYFFGMQGRNDVLTALDADSGKPLWSQSYEVKHKAEAPQAKSDENDLPLPEATPSIDAGRIYTYGGGGDLVCRQLKDGTQVWKLNILDETGAKILTWNESSSPLVTETHVYVQAGKDGPIAVAVDKNSGKIAWKSEATGLAGYAAPILINVGGLQQLVVFGGDTLVAMDPASGKTLWSQPWKTQYDVNATTPVYHDNHLFITSDYGHGCAMYSLSAGGANKDWENKEVMSRFQPVILDGDKLYANSEGRLKCLHWPDGKVIWKSNKVELGSGGSILKVGNQLIALSDKGRLSLVDLAGEPKVVGEAQAFDEGDNIWSSPVVYHGKLLLKGKTQLIAFDLGGH